MEAFTTFPFHLMEVWMSSKEEKDFFTDFFKASSYSARKKKIFTESEIIIYLFCMSHIKSHWHL